MKFYKLIDIAPRNNDQVFKASPTRKCIALVVFSALGIASLWVALHGGIHQGKTNVSAVLFYIMTVVFGLFAWYAFSVFRASLKPTNWLLRCDSGGVLIKYRSFYNWRFPADDIQVVGLDYSEIAWARTVKEKRLTPNMDGKGGAQIQYLTYLDFCLTNADTSALEANLQRERNLSPDGIVTTRDYPVSVSSGGIIELRWTGGISPSVVKAIQYLGQHVQIAAADNRKVDLVHRQNLSPEEERNKIIALLNSGDEMGAVKLAQQIYGYSLTEAQDFVDKLQGDS
jgi:hypothetical protein